MHNKKGVEMATNTIVMIVLGLVILVILIIFVQQQFKKSSGKYEQFGEEANTSVEKCNSLIKGQFCSNTCDTAKYVTTPNSPAGKPWSDCKGQSCCIPK